MNRLSTEDRAGLYITVIVHLLAVALLLCAGINKAISREETFVLDFTEQEKLEKAIEEARKEIERLEAENAMKAAVAENVERMLTDAGALSPRNVSVNRGALKDDRGTDADKLYRDAERLGKDLREGVKPTPEDFPGDVSQEDEKPDTKPYSGPSVLSWELEGRSAVNLPIPAYRGYGGGEVKVLISVDRNGRVVSARIDAGASTKDTSLHKLAINAAKRSSFNASRTAVQKQEGSIIYLFIAQ